MWMRALGSVIAVAGLLGAAYFGWALHRLRDGAVLYAYERPRPWPYPDVWLLRWERQLEVGTMRRAAERGDRPGLRIDGEIDAVRARLLGWIGTSLAIGAAGLTPLVPWYQRKRRARLLTGEAADYVEEIRPPDLGANADRGP